MPWLASENENIIHKLLNGLISSASPFGLSLRHSHIAEALLDAVESTIFLIG